MARTFRNSAQTYSDDFADSRSRRQARNLDRTLREARYMSNDDLRNDSRLDEFEEIEPVSYTSQSFSYDD